MTVHVLADRHHAGLYASLQYLGDRLGWSVYTPVGTEWWDEGYWRFGEVFGDDRLAAQYLSTDGGAWSGWSRNGEFYVTHDRDYPQRAIRGVTLAQARGMCWKYVVATVQENQRGLARFARENGAKYVYQVGNTRQQVDWSLDPLVIASSEVHLEHGVRYHQEMHPAYRWSPPTTHRAITSFVNLMPRIECWPALADHAARLPEFDWRIHGADCPDGLVNPTTAVAERMALSGWGWHDKPTGDGFGHVLWGWAAVGRPVIGHASHYRGQLGEVLWRDLETCIDLDRHPDAAPILRSITPEYHAEMCAAMRSAFEAHYDPAADAARIKEYLS